MNSFFVHAVATSLPNSGHSLLSTGEFCPCLSHALSRLKLNPLLNHFQLQLKHRISKNSKALNTALLLF